MKMKSRKTHSAARKSVSGRHRKVRVSVDAGEEPNKGRTAAADQDVSVKQKAPECDPADAEETQDNVEFPEAVVLVGKTHWRCVPCMVVCPRTSSIDEHLSTHHKCPHSDFALSISSSHQNEQGRTDNQNHAFKASERESERKVALSVLSTQHDENFASRKEATDSSIKVTDKELKNVQGSKRKRQDPDLQEARKISTYVPINEDSDTEVETPDLVSPVKALPEKKNVDISVLPSNQVSVPTATKQLERNENIDVEELSTPPNKRTRSGENNTVIVSSPQEPAAEIESMRISSRAKFKELLKEKYVVFVGKGGTLDCSLDTEGHMDGDAPLPIETPSLQADAFLPPATPLLPNIHGPPETPVAPETPHPPELFQPDHQQSVTLSLGVVPPAQHLSRSEGLPGYATNHEYGSAEMMSSRSDKEVVPASVCVTCGAAFDSPLELRLHREEMVKFDVVSCCSCGEKFHGLHQLNIHVFTTHEKLAKKFCFLCDADCLDGFELQEHLLEHTSGETDMEEETGNLESVHHTCKTCGQVVEGNLSDLLNHYHTTHDQYVCTRCYELFTDLTEYEDHKVLHCSQADSTVVYSCPVSDCFQLCEDKESLMNHISWHEDRDVDEEQQSLLTCLDCGERFRNMVSLQRHLADTHNDPDLRPFVCELCREAFSHSLELHQHNTLQHAGVKRYGCAYCHQRFAFRSAHRRHVAAQHDVAATILRM